MEGLLIFSEVLGVMKGFMQNLRRLRCLFILVFLRGMKFI